jgi:hypothetical protein
MYASFFTHVFYVSLIIILKIILNIVFMQNIESLSVQEKLQLLQALVEATPSIDLIKSFKYNRPAIGSNALKELAKNIPAGLVIETIVLSQSNFTDTSEDDDDEYSANLSKPITIQLIVYFYEGKKYYKGSFSRKCAETPDDIDEFICNIWLSADIAFEDFWEQDSIPTFSDELNLEELVGLLSY